MQTIDQYNEIENAARVEALVKEHASLVIKIAKNMKRRLPSNIEFDDLVQSGFVGLIEAGRNFKEGHGSSFETFASIRVKGSMLDNLRKNSINNRDILKQIKAFNETVSKIEQRVQRPATSIEIMQEMKINEEEYQQVCEYININHASNLDIEIEHNNLVGDGPTPEEQVIQGETKEKLKLLLAKLPQREQILLSLYYIEELTFKEISEVLDLTEARVCQLHAAIVAKLHLKL